MIEKAEAQPAELPRELNLAHALSVVVGTVVGSAVFLVPSQMMQAAGSVPLVALAWIVGGCLSLAGALCYAELGAARPQAGGEYVYLRDAYGPRTAFLYMWTWFAIAKPASVASVTSGLALTLGQLQAFAFLDTAVIHVAGHPLLLWSQVLAIAATWLITGLNCLGIRKAGDFQLVLTVLKLALIFGVVAACAFGANATAGGHNFSTRYSGALGGVPGFMVALIAALWAYDGWNDLNMVAGEVRRPRRNLPIALIGGTLGTGVLYLAVSAAIQRVLPAEAIAGTLRPAALALSHVAGHWSIVLLTIGMAVGVLVGLNGTIMSGARVPFAAARDRLFFRALGRVHPRFQSPANALVVQALLSTLLLLAVGQFQQLFELAIFAEWLFYALTATTVFVFRRRERAALRGDHASRTDGVQQTFRTPGYPVVPALFVAASCVLLWYSYVASLRNSLLGTGLILCGLLLYPRFARGAQEQDDVF